MALAHGGCTVCAAVAAVQYQILQTFGLQAAADEKRCFSSKICMIPLFYTACQALSPRGGTRKRLVRPGSKMTAMTRKGIAACGAALASAEFALRGACMDNVHGIPGNPTEDTMRNMGPIASPGMVRTGKTIGKIRENKRAAAHP